MIDELLEKKLPSGEIVTLDKYLNEWIVDMWDENNENRWNRSFSTYIQAKVEFDRWN